MRPTDFIQEMYYFVHNIPDISAEMDRILKMLDAKYQLSNLEEVTAKNENLMSIQRSALHELLKSMKPCSMVPQANGKATLTR